MSRAFRRAAPAVLGTLAIALVLLSAASPSVAIVTSLALSQYSGPVGTVVTVSGGGYVPNTQYSLCFTTVAPSSVYPYQTCPPISDDSSVYVVTDSFGDIPTGTKLTVPTGASGTIYAAMNYYSCPNPNLTPCASTPFTVTTLTTTTTTIQPCVGNGCGNEVPEFPMGLAFLFLVAVPLLFLMKRMTVGYTLRRQ